MNDMEFIEKLKEKRNACGYLQARLARELHISRQNLNEIEIGKGKASREMKHMILHYLDYCKCEQPLPNVTPHILRHTFCTRFASKNINPKNLQILMGIATPILL